MYLVLFRKNFTDSKVVVCFSVNTVINQILFCVSFFLSVQGLKFV